MDSCTIMSSSTMNVSEEIDHIFSNYHYSTFQFDACVEDNPMNISDPDNEGELLYFNDAVFSNIMEPSHNHLRNIFTDCSDASPFASNARCTKCQANMIDNGCGFSIGTCLKCTSNEENKRTLGVRNPRSRKTNRNAKKTSEPLNAKPYQCKYCDEYFSSIRTLLDHVKIHSDIHCDICGKSFYTPTELKEHEKIHNGTSATGKRIRTTSQSSPSEKYKTSSNEERMRRVPLVHLKGSRLK